MALNWFRRIFGPGPPPAPRLVHLVNRLDDLDARLEYLSSELKALRGRFYGDRRKKTLQDAPGEEIEEGEVSQDTPPPAQRPRQNTTSLARRFRVGG